MALGGIKLGEGERDKDWWARKLEAPSHWMVGSLKLKFVVVVAAAAAAVGGPVVAEDTAAAVEQ